MVSDLCKCDLRASILQSISPQEWDFPNEFFYNTTTQQLYYNYNGTGTPGNDDVIMTHLKVLFNVTSSRWNPIRNITFRGLTFTASQITYMVGHVSLLFLLLLLSS